MRRAWIAGIAAGLLLVSATAAAGDRPGVRGAGFIRDNDGGKSILIIAGFDNGLTGDSGKAVYARHTLGERPRIARITLNCVVVEGATALASGTGSNGKAYLIGVRDNGNKQEGPDEFGVTEIVGATELCVTGGVAQDGILGSIDGGNFKVFD